MKVHEDARPSALAPDPGATPRLRGALAFGEITDALLLRSTRVRPERLLASGYSFRFPELEGALRHLLGRAAA